MTSNIPIGKELDIFLAMDRPTQIQLFEVLLKANDAIDDMTEAIQREAFWADNSEDGSVTSPHYESMGVLLFETLQELGEITYE